MARKNWNNLLSISQLLCVKNVRDYRLFWEMRSIIQFMFLTPSKASHGLHRKNTRVSGPNIEPLIQNDHIWFIDI